MFSQQKYRMFSFTLLYSNINRNCFPHSVECCSRKSFIPGKCGDKARADLEIWLLEVSKSYSVFAYRRNVVMSTLCTLNALIIYYENRDISCVFVINACMKAAFDLRSRSVLISFSLGILDININLIIYVHHLI